MHPRTRHPRSAAGPCASERHDSNSLERCVASVQHRAKYESWERAIAASGIVAIAHATESEPASDLRRVWDMVVAHADALALDRDRCGLWACSSHGACTSVVKTDLAVGVSNCDALWHFAGLDAIDLPRRAAVTAANHRGALRPKAQYEVVNDRLKLPPLGGTPHTRPARARSNLMIASSEFAPGRRLGVAALTTTPSASRQGP